MFTLMESGNLILLADGIEGWDPTVNEPYTELYFPPKCGKNKEQPRVFWSNLGWQEIHIQIVLLTVNLWFFQALHAKR